MTSIIRMMLCFVIMALTACAGHHEQAMCKQSCQQRFKTCSKLCQNNCQACEQSSKRTTTRNYNNYKHEQCVRGEFIGRELNFYRDPLQCRKITCDCPADYDVCTQSCEGVIHKRLQIAPVCC